MDQQRTRIDLGLPLWAVIGMAALALPRVLLHDLGVDVGTFGIVILAVGPPAIWVFVAIRARVPSPVLTLASRNVRPLFVNREITICGEPAADGKSAKLWAQDDTGALALSAEATF